MLTTSTNRLTPLAWHGWRIDLPERWSPVKLDGDAARGMILLADLHRPRLGVRWNTLKASADVAAAVDRAMRDEVGELAAKEAVTFLPPGENWTSGKLYIEPNPPGRDVWIGFSRVTRRMFQIVHHAKHRDRALVDQLLPTLTDDEDGYWSIFDLSCHVPAGARLTKQRLNVGDLSLEFKHGPHVMAIRQIAVASVAIQRQPIERWLVSQQSARKQFYRPIENVGPATYTGRDAIGRTLVRRRRHFLLRYKPRTIFGVAMRDEHTDRLIIAESSDKLALLKLLNSIGWTEHKNP
ncbi:hypothetical protein BH10PLA1_BH10PLA1_02390 [soil metagenome]